MDNLNGACSRQSECRHAFSERCKVCSYWYTSEFESILDSEEAVSCPRCGSNDVEKIDVDEFHCLNCDAEFEINEEM